MRLQQSTIDARMRRLRDLHAWGVFARRERLRRTHPGATRAQLAKLLEQELIHANGGGGALRRDASR